MTGATPENVTLYDGGLRMTPGPTAGGGLLLEDGVFFLLLEDGSFLLLEE